MTTRNHDPAAGSVAPITASDTEKDLIEMAAAKPVLTIREFLILIRTTGAASQLIVGLEQSSSRTVSAKTATTTQEPVQMGGTAFHLYAAGSRGC